MPTLFEDYPEGDMDFKVVPPDYEPGGPWFDVPSTIVLDNRLSVHAKLLGVLFCRTAKLGTQFNEEIFAEQMGVSVLSIPKYLKELVTLGYFKIRPGEGKGGTTLYSVIVDPK